MWIGVRGWYVPFLDTLTFTPFHYEDRCAGVVCGLFTTCSLAPFYYKDRCARVVCGLFTTCSLAPFYYKDRYASVVCGLFSTIILSPFPSLAVCFILLYELLMIAD